MPDAPNPGSKQARELGCLCAVLDNNWGLVPVYPPNGWWITADCPLHGVGIRTEDVD